MLTVTQWLDQRFYESFSDNWDDSLFRREICRYVDSESDVLDLGAGAGKVVQMDFRGIVRRVCGIDLDPRVTSNPFLDEGRIGDLASLPYADRSFDVVFADNVAEHLERPEAVRGEIHRVLRPGGMFFFKTPNKWHYMPLIARITPLWFHKFINRLRGREEVDTFPTRYRLNSRAVVARVAARTGFEVVDIKLVEGRPEYLRMAWPLYLVGIAYERIVNSFEVLARFRILLIATLRRPA